MDSRNEGRRYFVDGNTVRKLNTVPKRDHQPEQEQRKEKKVDPRVARNARRAKAFDFKYMILLVCATGFLFVSCVRMLSLQEEITENRKLVAQLECNLNEQKNSNAEKSKRLESSVDLTKIYDVAVNELGMVYPQNGQVISYEASNPDYVKQFKDVPEK